MASSVSSSVVSAVVSAVSNAQTRFSPAARDYFARLDAAGDTTYPAYKTPLANYIDALVALGGAYWTTANQSVCYVGVGVQGCFVPLKSGMTVPTNFNFVSGDLSVTSGLIGNGSNKYSDSNIIDSVNGNDDLTVAVYVTGAATTAFECYFGSSDSGDGAFRCIVSSSLTYTGIQMFSNASANLTTDAAPLGLVGKSRNNSTSTVDYRIGGVSGSGPRTAQTPIGNDIAIFASRKNLGAASRHMNARYAAHHIATGMSQAEMEVLETLQATLISEIAAI